MYNQIDSNRRKTWLLIIIFIAFITLLGLALGYASDYGYSLMLPAAILAIFIALAGYYSGDKLALLTAGAQPINKEQNIYVYRLVENLCITAGLPMPKIYLINDPAINAFATGRDPKNASIALTIGAVKKLENEELEGVIAHELSHIKNYDIRLMTLVIVLVGLVALASDWFLRGQIFGRRGRDSDSGGGYLAIIGLILIILSPLIAQLIKLAVSRSREYLADASGALLTRYPEGLARALEKINGDSDQLRRVSSATAHLYIANPFKKGGALVNLFATHPPIAERIKRLKGMT